MFVSYEHAYLCVLFGGPPAVHPPANENRPALTYRLARFVGFLILATAGMATIALALLAGPLDVYYDDAANLRQARQRIDDLQNLADQRAELLANADNPSVLERAAIGRLNYVPALPHLPTESTPPAPWPRLHAALARLDQPPPQPADSPLEHLAVNLAADPGPQSMLFLFGSALVVISLTFFNRRIG